MAVDGEAEIQGQRTQIIVFVEQVQGARKPTAQLLAVKWQALHLLKRLGEADRRCTCEPAPRIDRLSAEIGAER